MGTMVWYCSTSACQKLGDMRTNSITIAGMSMNREAMDILYMVICRQKIYCYKSLNLKDTSPTHTYLDHGHIQWWFFSPQTSISHEHPRYALDECCAEIECCAKNVALAETPANTQVDTEQNGANSDKPAAQNLEQRGSLGFNKEGEQDCPNDLQL